MEEVLNRRRLQLRRAIKRDAEEKPVMVSNYRVEVEELRGDVC
jgi:hypothetical protein